MKIAALRTRVRLCVACLAMLVLGFRQPTRAADILIADRLNSNVYRYSETGTLLNAVLPAPGPGDQLQLSQAVGLALSPDLEHLYVSSYLNRRVLRYDYDYATGTASAGIIFADAADGLMSPNAILFSEDGSTIYVSNLGQTGLSRFHLDGSSAGAPLFFAAPDQTSHSLHSGLAWAPDGDLLVNSWRSFPTGTHGAVGRFSSGDPAIEMFVEPDTSINGASGIMVHDGFVYVTGMFSNSVRRFDLDTGAIDPSFAIDGPSYPQGLLASPDGNGFLLGVLNVGTVEHYDFNGVLVGDGIFAEPGGGGFAEATAFIAVPDLPGDFNRDGVVDADDLSDPVDGWRDRFGDDLDGDDLLVWQRNLHQPTPSVPAVQPAAATVPEPAAAALALLAVLVCGGQGRACASRLYAR